MSSCCVDLASGIGNTLAALPVIEWANHNYNKVYANYISHGFPRKLFNEAWGVIKDNFDDLYVDVKNPKVDCHIKSPLLPPILGKISKFSIPEYQQYFVGNNIEVPDNLDWQVDYKDIDGQVDVLFVPTSKPEWKSKIWKKWGELAEYFKDHTLGVVGINKEGGQFPDYVKDFRNQLSLAQIGGLAKKAKVIIGHDSGVTNYLGYLGVSNLYFVYGSTEPQKNMPPPREGQYIIASNIPCRPCQSKNPPFAKNHGCSPLYCLEDLTAEHVYHFVEQSFQSFADKGYNLK